MIWNIPSSIFCLRSWHFSIHERVTKSRNSMVAHFEWTVSPLICFNIGQKSRDVALTDYLSRSVPVTFNWSLTPEGWEKNRTRFFITNFVLKNFSCSTLPHANGASKDYLITMSITDVSNLSQLVRCGAGDRFRGPRFYFKNTLSRTIQKTFRMLPRNPLFHNSHARASIRLWRVHVCVY